MSLLDPAESNKLLSDREVVLGVELNILFLLDQPLPPVFPLAPLSFEGHLNLDLVLDF